MNTQKTHIIKEAKKAIETAQDIIVRGSDPNGAMIELNCAWGLLASAENARRLHANSLINAVMN